MRNETRGDSPGKSRAELPLFGYGVFLRFHSAIVAHVDFALGNESIGGLFSDDEAIPNQRE